MKINPNFSSFNISSKGMSIQKKKMELITENIANTSTTKTSDGTPYQRKFISVKQEKDVFNNLNSLANLKSGFSLKVSDKFFAKQISNIIPNDNKKDDYMNISEKENTDKTEGELVYMPEHPDADEDGYVKMPNVSIITEMVDMIAASRSFEANLTAFNSAKQIAKDSLEI